MRFVIAIIGFILASWAVVGGYHWDWMVHPYLHNQPWHWYYLFTTDHAMTMIYFSPHPFVAQAFVVFVGLIWAAIAIVKFD